MSVSIHLCHFEFGIKPYFYVDTTTYILTHSWITHENNELREKSVHICMFMCMRDILPLFPSVGYC